LKFVSSLVSVLVFVCVIFGAPIYDATHGNWLGAGYRGPRSAAAIRSGEAAKALEKTLEARSQLDELTRPRFDELRFLALGVTNKGVGVGPNDWLFPKLRLKPLPRTHEADLKRSVVAMGAIVRHLESHGTRVIFELIPRRSTLYHEELPIRSQERFVSAYDMVRDAMLAENLDVPDLRPALVEGGELRYMRNDEHWQPAGSLAAAKVIARALQTEFGESGPPGPPVDVNWRKLPPKDFRGSLQRLLGFTEGGYLDRRFSEEIVGIRAVDANGRKRAYNGSKEYRPILLVGSSYSNSQYCAASQFIGLLKVDIQRHVKAGYGAGFRIVEVLKRILTGRTDYPEVLIWEFPEEFPVREGGYFHEPLESIAAVLDHAPYDPQPIGPEWRELEAVKIIEEEPQSIRAIAKNRKSKIVLRLPEPIPATQVGEAATVLCFDLRPSASGPLRGYCRISWGGGEPYSEYGAVSRVIRRDKWLHTLPQRLTAPSTALEDLMVDRVVIEPFTARTEIEFGHVELWTPLGNGPR
jgi:hypothetical protein